MWTTSHDFGANFKRRYFFFESQQNWNLEAWCFRYSLFSFLVGKTTSIFHVWYCGWLDGKKQLVLLLLVSFTSYSNSIVTSQKTQSTRNFQLWHNDCTNSTKGRLQGYFRTGKRISMRRAGLSDTCLSAAWNIKWARLMDCHEKPLTKLAGDSIHCLQLPKRQDMATSHQTFQEGVPGWWLAAKSWKVFCCLRAFLQIHLTAGWCT